MSFETEKENEKEYETIMIPVSDGSEREFAIIQTFLVEGQSYMAVSLIEDDIIQDGVYIYRYTDNEDGDVTVSIIDRPAEYKRVTKAFEKLQND